ncbi:MAG: hypothetical protein LIR50_03845 [Bacillota bacterium]|nr:hypothetical protein [Bacillota bacterium]
MKPLIKVIKNSSEEQILKDIYGQTIEFEYVKNKNECTIQDFPRNTNNIYINEMEEMI